MRALQLCTEAWLVSDRGSWSWGFRVSEGFISVIRLEIKGPSIGLHLYIKPTIPKFTNFTWVNFTFHR